MTTLHERLLVDRLANEIRSIDGRHKMGAGALAEALMPFLAALQSSGGEVVALVQVTAPERIYLAVSDNTFDRGTPFPDDAGWEHVSWSTDEPLAVCVPYTRADLAAALRTPADGDGGRAVDVLCIQCGRPTMHVGKVCFFCSKAAKTTRQEARAVGVACHATRFEDWLGAVEDAGEIASNARDPMIVRRAKRLVAWIETQKPTPPTQQEAQP